MVGADIWGEMLPLDKVNRILIFMQHMNLMTSLLHGQATDAQTLVITEEDKEPLGIEQRPMADMLREVIRIAARVGDVAQVMSPSCRSCSSSSMDSA